MRNDFGNPAAHNLYREMYSVLAALAALDLSAQDIQQVCQFRRPTSAELGQ
jgi:hypothetical protein